MKNSELSVYQAETNSNAYLIPPQYYLDDYSAFQTASYEDDSSFAISDASNGEDTSDVDIDNVETADDEE